ncbi:polysaccharide pyruvyl transferase family protein, partial [candidate division WOR-3 bacterium]|nr:polysaccharide pyruvyl transferase family protein [candidate division WOR-3 bacterium]
QEFSKFPGIEVIVFSSNPKQVSATHGVRSVRSQGRSSLLRRIWELKTSNLFILGGGDLLKDYGSDSSSLEEWLRLLRLAKRLNVKTALCAIGVVNIRYDDSRKLIRDALEGVDLITVRDRNSKDILIDIGVTNEVKVVTDPAVLLANISASEINDISMPPKVIICVRHWFDKGFYIEKPEINDNFIRSLGVALDFLAEHYMAEIDFIPFRTTSYDDDRIVAKQVVSYMNHKDRTHIHSRAPGVDEFIEMAKQSSLVIGMRLHSLILGTSVGVPVIGLAYMPKVEVYLDSISQSEYSLNLETITGEKLISLIESIFKNYDTNSKKILSGVSKLQMVAKKSIVEMVELAGDI